MPRLAYRYTLRLHPAGFKTCQTPQLKDELTVNISILTIATNNGFHIWINRSDSYLHKKICHESINLYRKVSIYPNCVYFSLSYDVLVLISIAVQQLNDTSLIIEFSS